MLLPSLIGGITLGSLYALMALGPSLVYGLLRVLDIANIAGLVLGAYLGARLFEAGWPWWAGLLVGVAASAVFGWLMQRLVFRPLLGHPPLIPLIASIGVFIAMEEVFRLVFGPYPLHYSADVGIPSLHIGSTIVTGDEWLIIGIGASVLLATWWTLSHTRLGLAWRATSLDGETARAMGIDANRVVTTIFLLGYGLAALAGVLVGIHYQTVYPTMGDIPAYKVLAIIVLGGLGNPLGTIAAALLIGLAETFVTAYVGFAIPRDAIAFMLLILVLLVRPQGLLPGGVVRA